MDRTTHHVILWPSLIVWSIVLHLIVWIHTEWLYFDMVMDSWFTIPGIVIVLGICLHGRRVGPALSMTILPSLAVAIAAVSCYSIRWSWTAVAATLLVNAIVVRATVERVVFTHTPGRCRECDYDLTGNKSGVCPECGTPSVGLPIPYRAPRIRLPVWRMVALVLAVPLVFGFASWEKRLPSKRKVDALVADNVFIGLTTEEVAEVLNIPSQRAYLDGPYTIYELPHLSSFLSWYAIRLTMEDGVVMDAEGYWESF